MCDYSCRVCIDVEGVWRMSCMCGDVFGFGVRCVLLVLCILRLVVCRVSVLHIFFCIFCCDPGGFVYCRVRARAIHMYTRLSSAPSRVFCCPGFACFMVMATARYRKQGAQGGCIISGRLAVMSMRACSATPYRQKDRRRFRAGVCTASASGSLSCRGSSAHVATSPAPGPPSSETPLLLCSTRICIYD